jgi:hypothetical protein
MKQRVDERKFDGTASCQKSKFKKKFDRKVVEVMSSG